MIELPPEYGHEILRSEVGSTLHGTGLPGGEDLDLMGVYIEGPASTIGLESHEHWDYRTADKDERSGPGDIDLIVYSAKKWCRLALNGNPSVLLPLFAPERCLYVHHPLGLELRKNAEWFASKRAGRAFLGYLARQRDRLVGDRGRAGRIRSRGECPNCEGDGNIYSGNIEPIRSWKCPECGGSGLLADYKYMMHMLRLGYQGVEFLETGRLTLPIPSEIGDYLRSVRRGDVSVAECLDEASLVETRIKQLLDGDSPLPDKPNMAAVQRWLIDAHLGMWNNDLGSFPNIPPEESLA